MVLGRKCVALNSYAVLQKKKVKNTLIEVEDLGQWQSACPEFDSQPPPKVYFLCFDLKTLKKEQQSKLWKNNDKDKSRNQGNKKKHIIKSRKPKISSLKRMSK